MLEGMNTPGEDEGEGDGGSGSTHYRTRTGVHLPKDLLEPRSLSSKKDRERRNLRYIPPAPRPVHYARSAPSQTRLIHSRLGSDNQQELDNSFHALMGKGTPGNVPSFFRTNFEIQERLGFGSFGDVYHVKSKLDYKEYAVKKTRRVYNGEWDRARQLREVNRMAAIDPNPHLVELETAWEEDGHLYFQLELCSKSLYQDIEEGSYLTADEAWNVLIDMLYALQHLHKNQLVHMDVKPENIFVSLGTPKTYKLGDFGIIVCLKEKRDMSEYTEGDSRYLAPEVMQGCVSTKADVFSLGLTVLEISCHVDLPKGGSLWHELRSGVLPEPTDQLVPSSLESVIRYMITPDLDQRPEIENIIGLEDVQQRMKTRKWMCQKAIVQQKFQRILGIIKMLFALFTALFFKKKDDVAPLPRNGDDDDASRRTPEPMLLSRDIPSVMLNDSSFSDDDEVRKTPVLASTPISHSSLPKTASTGGARLRGSRLFRMGPGDDKLYPAGTGSPSRNLLKEFEAAYDYND